MPFTILDARPCSASGRSSAECRIETPSRVGPMVLAAILACGSSTLWAASPPPTPPAATVAAGAVEHPAMPGGPCGSGRSMAVHFFDVGQGLAVVVDLPDGRHVLVDAGDDPRRRECDDCGRNHAHLIDKLRSDLGQAPIDLLWITHQHSDHMGGASDVLRNFHVLVYVDNGRDGNKAEVRRVREVSDRRGTLRRVVDPEHVEIPLAAAPGVTFAPILPRTWPGSCARDENECSIGLRIDFCSSSVLFVGDAEHEEEQRLDPRGPVTLLQVGHHGSETSTSPAFVSRVRPTYAVISAGKPDAGMNREYCHPRAIIVERLTRITGGPGVRTMRAFDGERCDRAQPSDWIDVPSSDRVWATARDGDVVLVTTGDGRFVKK